MTRMTKQWWLYLSATLLALAVGCGTPPPPEDTSGSAQLFGALAQALTAADVTQVRVTVSATDMQPRTAELVKTNNQWSGVLGKLPAGSGRTFSAEAFNSGGTKLYAGVATGVTLVAKGTTTVSITLQEVNPVAPFANAAPVITALSAAPGNVEPGGTVTLNASASDANPGDTLGYAWSAPSGSFAQPGSLSTTWTAPASAAVVPLTLTVTDSKGVQGKVTFNVNVNAGKGDSVVNASLNTWPQVSNVSTSAAALDVNESTTVSATASDNDGDTLSYSWAASCAGTWANATSATAQFTATALPASSVCNNCNLTVTVTDSRNGQPIGGQTTGTLSLCVGPKGTALFPPEIVETFQSTASTSAGGTVTFRVKAVDPQGSAMRFSWSANTGTLGAPSTSADASEVVWTAPSSTEAGVTPTLTVVVTNGHGLSASKAFTVSGVPTGPTYPAGTLTSGGLTWIRPGATTSIWGDGKAYCASTAFAGQTGWRMPTQAELLALGADKGASFMADQGWTLDWIWSMTPFSYGHTAVRMSTVSSTWGDMDDKAFVTCVRGTGTYPANVTNGGLTWLMPDATKRTYPSSETYCTSTAISGRTGWRLPTQSELEALHAAKGSSYLANAGWTLDWLWTSTPYSGSMHIAVGDAGAISWGDNDDLAHTTCVYPAILPE